MTLSQQITWYILLYAIIAYVGIILLHKFVKLEPWFFEEDHIFNRYSLLLISLFIPGLNLICFALLLYGVPREMLSRWIARRRLRKVADHLRDTHPDVAQQIDDIANKYK